MKLSTYFNKYHFIKGWKRAKGYEDSILYNSITYEFTADDETSIIVRLFQDNTISYGIGYYGRILDINNLPDLESEEYKFLLQLIEDLPYETIGIY